MHNLTNTDNLTPLPWEVILLLILCLLVLGLVVIAAVYMRLIWLRQIQGQHDVELVLKWQAEQMRDQSRSNQADQTALRESLNEKIMVGALIQQRNLQELQSKLTTHLSESRLAQQDSLQSGLNSLRTELTDSLTKNVSILIQQVEKLTDKTDQRLHEISGQVEKRLTEGFEKTTETFSKVLVHLNRIDEAQKKIIELSSNVVSLQQVLSDKSARGAFGEVQLNALVRNMMPESAFKLQHTLSNGKRADCMLVLPEPTGNLIIDAKFPLESYQRLQQPDLSQSEQTGLQRRFREDIKRHIEAIAGKYILPGETSDGAMMFIPAEAVFAEIHAHYPELVETAYRCRVWLVSPTTMMAILTTARAVLKDAATKEQVHVIQRHLGELSKDFDRFKVRMQKLATHISQAHSDVAEVNTSARKISQRFERIEQVEIDESPNEELPIYSGSG